MPKIMVVDEDADLVRLIQFRLETDGFEVVSCGDGAAAMKLAEEEHPDLILLDIMMPVMDGMEALRQIKGHRTTGRIPIIMLTAKTDSSSVDAARAMGVAEYIMKPFDPEKLVSKVRKVLKMPMEA
jgi:DNA-binding response OmpR family regulator